MKTPTLRTVNWGLLPYKEAWERQLVTAEEVKEGAPDTLIFVEHPPVLTLGAGFHPENLLFTEEEYRSRGIEVVKTDRGGDVTYHGPGQLVIYPVFDLTRHGKDLHLWMRKLEEAIIHALAPLGISGGRSAGQTGVWIESRKIASIGVKMKRWVSIHGIALNCSNDMAPFEWIIPCGIADKPMTSVTAELGRLFTPEEAIPLCVEGFQAEFLLSVTSP
jgi:lipoyl(octanoyl) transferase